MNLSSRPLIDPLTDAQRQKVAALAEQLRDAEASTARELLAAGATPDTLQAVLENASGFAEAMTQKLRDPSSPPVACKEDCSWCCYQLVRVSAPEAFRIVRFLNGESIANDRAHIIDQLDALDKATRGLSPQLRVKIPKPCAFLEDGRCTVYPVRPLACAEFTSYDVRVCKRGRRVGFKPGSVIHEKARMVAYNAVQQGLADGLRKALPSADTSWLELTAAVVSALQSADTETSWLAGGNVFARAHLAGVAK